MDTIYFYCAETRPEQFLRYRACWLSAIALPNAPRLVVLDEGMAPQLRDLVPPEVEVHAVERWPATIMGAQRVLYSLQALARDTESRCVMVADCRDVIFQRDPFEGWLERVELCLAGEGPLMQQDEWNLGDQRTFQLNIPPEQRKIGAGWEVVCAGVVAGSQARMLELYGQLWELVSHARYGTDQGALNYLYNTALRGDATVARAPVGWCLSGHHYRYHGARYRDGEFVDREGRAYAVVHQWDRTEWEPLVVPRWSGKVTAGAVPANA